MLFDSIVTGSFAEIVPMELLVKDITGLELLVKGLAVCSFNKNMSKRPRFSTPVTSVIVIDRLCGLVC